MKNKTALNIILFISIFVLISAYFVEYILGYKPCGFFLLYLSKKHDIKKITSVELSEYLLK